MLGGSLYAALPTTIGAPETFAIGRPHTPQSTGLALTSLSTRQRQTLCDALPGFCQGTGLECLLKTSRCAPADNRNAVSLVAQMQQSFAKSPV